MFVTTLRSSGYNVVKATAVFGEATDDRQLLEYCAAENHLFVTNDKTDFGGTVGDAVDHAGIIIYTDPVFLQTEPDRAVRTIDRVLRYYPPAELAGERIWLEQWRE